MLDLKHYPGLFVAVEGPDGTGKSELARQIRQELEGCGIPSLLTREPGGTPFAEEVRRILLSPDIPVDSVIQAMLLNAARRDHVRQVIAPALVRGEVVITDRFVLSTAAYQGPEMGFKAVFDLHRSHVGLLPDLMFVVDVDTDIILGRLRERIKNEAAGINEATDRQGIEARRCGYRAALQAARAAFASEQSDKVTGWCYLNNDQPLQVAVNEAVANILRARTTREKSHAAAC